MRQFMSRIGEPFFLYSEYGHIYNLECAIVPGTIVRQQ